MDQSDSGSAGIFYMVCVLGETQKQALRGLQSVCRGTGVNSGAQGMSSRAQGGTGDEFKSTGVNLGAQGTSSMAQG
eukprot:1195786-Prorocentrum_minimum.AAC.5